MAKRKALYKSFKHEGGFVGIPRRVFNSDEYRTLSIKARCLLDELQNICHNHNNGRLVFSNEQASQRLNITRKYIGHAFNELQDAGFIECMTLACHRTGKAREWRLTFQPCNGHEPTDEWRKK